MIARLMFLVMIPTTPTPVWSAAAPHDSHSGVVHSSCIISSLRRASVPLLLNLNLNKVPYCALQLLGESLPDSDLVQLAQAQKTPNTNPIARRSHQLRTQTRRNMLQSPDTGAAFVETRRWMKRDPPVSSFEDLFEEIGRGRAGGLLGGARRSSSSEQGAEHHLELSTHDFAHGPWTLHTEGRFSLPTFYDPVSCISAVRWDFDGARTVYEHIEWREDVPSMW